MVCGQAGDQRLAAGAWEHTALPGYAPILTDRLAFAWHAMDAFYEEDERILGHAADAYHRIDIRQTTRDLTVHAGDADRRHHTALVLTNPVSPRAGTSPEAMSTPRRCPGRPPNVLPVQGPVQLLRHRRRPPAAWSYREPYREVERIADFISFEPDKVTVLLDDKRLQLEPGQTVVSHGIDRDLTLHELTESAPLT